MASTDIPLVKEWLDQFEIPDRYLAEHVLRKIRFISFEELDGGLQQAVIGLLNYIEKAHGKEAVALFPVNKPFNEEKTKPDSDSSGRVSHLLQNVMRLIGTPLHVELNPTDDSMRARKVKHLIFVDDYTGTGNRFIKFWRTNVSRRVKFWLARKWCQIWIVSYAGHQQGLDRIVSQIRPALKSNVICPVTIGNSQFRTNRNLLRMAWVYGQKLSTKKSILGYGKLMSPIVFQYGCPNNAPGILWSKGSPGSRRWKPLFPNRGVPEELYDLFSMDLSKESTPEELWMARNYQLAINFLEMPDRFREKHDLLTVLVNLKAKKNIDKIRDLLILGDKEFEKILVDLQSYGLTDHDNNVTGFGAEALKRGSKARNKSVGDEDEYMNFYPSRFLGFQREV